MRYELTVLLRWIYLNSSFLRISENVFWKKTKKQSRPILYGLANIVINTIDHNHFMSHNKWFILRTFYIIDFAQIPHNCDPTFSFESNFFPKKFSEKTNSAINKTVFLNYQSSPGCGFIRFEIMWKQSIISCSKIYFYNVVLKNKSNFYNEFSVIE